MVGKGVNLMLLPDRPAGTLTLLADDLTAEQVAEFRAAVPPGVLDVKVDTSFAYDLDHLTREELPYEAGLHLTVAPAHIPPGLIGPRDGGLRTTPDSHEGNCTSAFWGQWSDGIDTFNYGITAGHCGNTGTDVSIGTTYISGVGTNAFYRSDPTNSDSSRFFVSSNRTSWPPRVMTGPNGHRTVRGRWTNDAINNGSRLCFQGFTSGADNCGTVVYDDIRVTTRARGDIPSRTVNHLWCIDFPSEGGDSGGPYYHVNADQSGTAVGIVHGHAVTDSFALGVGCFTSIDWALTELNLSLVSA